jgi:hypothetical protein
MAKRSMPVRMKRVADVRLRVRKPARKNLLKSRLAEVKAKTTRRMTTRLEDGAAFGRVVASCDFISRFCEIGGQKRVPCHVVQMPI